MSRDYAEQKLSEALRLAGGSPAKARMQIQTWLYEDHRLLLEITRPHWNGIVAYAVDRAVARALRGDEAPKEVPQLTKEQERLEEHFGKDVLRSFVSEHAAQFGLEISPVPKRAASQTHIDALHLIAAKSKQKDKD